MSLTIAQSVRQKQTHESRFERNFPIFKLECRMSLQFVVFRCTQQINFHRLVICVENFKLAANFLLSLVPRRLELSHVERQYLDPIRESFLGSKKNKRELDRSLFKIESFHRHLRSELSAFNANPMEFRGNSSKAVSRGRSTLKRFTASSYQRPQNKNLKTSDKTRLRWQFFHFFDPHSFAVMSNERASETSPFHFWLRSFNCLRVLLLQWISFFCYFSSSFCIH